MKFVTCNEHRGIIIASTTSEPCILSAVRSNSYYILTIILQVFWCTYNYSLPRQSFCSLRVRDSHPSIHSGSQFNLFCNKGADTKKGGELLVEMREKCARCETRKIEMKKQRRECEYTTMHSHTVQSTVMLIALTSASNQTAAHT